MLEIVGSFLVEFIFISIVAGIAFLFYKVIPEGKAKRILFWSSEKGHAPLSNGETKLRRTIYVIIFIGFYVFLYAIYEYNS